MYPKKIVRTYSRRQAEVVNALADIALAARAGELIRAYQREWSWIDKQNFIDAVDADEFNEAFHDIEREFDRLAEILGLGGGTLPPPWESEVIALTKENPWILLQHDLNSINLHVDLQIKVPPPLREVIAKAANRPELDPTREWWGGVDAIGDRGGLIYILPDPNHILIYNEGLGEGTPALEVRALIWKW